MNRLDREHRTLDLMVRLYCGKHHGTGSGSCEACRTLATYAHERIERCKFGAAKPICARCPIHCYKPAMRERVRAVMRYAGPRMLLRHPILAVAHLLDRFRRAGV